MQQSFTFINEYSVRLDTSVIGDLKSFKEEVLNELYNKHKLHGDMTLLYSGGMDSTFILRSLIELGLKPKITTFSFTPDNSDGDCQFVKKKCDKYGVSDIEFFYIDKEKIFNHMEYLVEKRNIVYPMIHGYFMDYFLKTFKHQKFLTGMSCEYKYINGKIKLPPGPLMVMQNNPGQLHCFNSDRTFLSYVKHKKFIDNYKKHPNTGNIVSIYDQLFIRDLIYMDCYPDIEKEIKNPPHPWRDDINDRYYNLIEPQLKIKFPNVFNMDPCFFDADYLVNL